MSENRFRRWGFDERLVLWYLLLIGGFAWVAMVQCGRPSPFAGRGGDHTQFIRLMLLGLPLYFVGPRHVLRAWSEEGARSLRWNVPGYVIPFFVGLQFFYLQRIDAINYSVTWEDLSTMGGVARVVFGAVALLILGLAVFHVGLARREGIAKPYVATFLGALLFIAVWTWLVRESRYLHIHHWFLFCFFVPFARFRHPVSVVAQALCAGIAVEGVAEWSMSTIWELR